MPSRALTSQRIGRGPPLALLLVALAGCPPLGSGGGGGITIAQNDATPPTLSFGVGQSGGPNVSVSAGGSAQNGNLTSKTGPLNLLATANDPESGVQALEIFFTSTVTNCSSNGICTGPPTHGLVGSPTYSSTSPQKQPGQTTSASSILADVMDLTKEIPQGSVSPGDTRIVRLYFWAVGKNHLGGTSKTPELLLTWKEP